MPTVKRDSLQGKSWTDIWRHTGVLWPLRQIVLTPTKFKKARAVPSYHESEASRRARLRQQLVPLNLLGSDSEDEEGGEGGAKRDW